MNYAKNINILTLSSFVHKVRIKTKQHIATNTFVCVNFSQFVIVPSDIQLCILYEYKDNSYRIIGC